MDNQDGYLSDSESSTTATSDVTSRATTPSDSWHSATGEHPQKLKNLFIPPSLEDDRSAVSSIIAPSVSPAVQKKSALPPNHDNNSQIQQNQQRQITWVNPYWSPGEKPNTSESQLQSEETNANINTEQTSSLSRMQQLIPGSILLNDQDEIDDIPSRQKTNPQTSSSNSNTFRPDNVSSVDFLAPISIQRQIIRSAPELSEYPKDSYDLQRSNASSAVNRQQTSSDKKNNDVLPWVNPYWPTPNPQTSSPNSNNFQSNGGSSVDFLAPTLIQREIVRSAPELSEYPEDSYDFQRSNSSSAVNRQQTSSGKIDNDVQPWVNPYWSKADRTNSQITQKESILQNTTSRPSNNSNQGPWINPYWKDSKSQTSTKSTQEWQNPYWNDRNTFNPSQVRSTNTKTENIPSSAISSRNPNVNNTFPLASDSHRTTPHGASGSSPSNKNQTANLPPASSNSQPSISSSAPPPWMDENKHSSSTVSSSNILTEADLKSIERALYLLENDPNVISILKIPEKIPPKNVINRNPPSLPVSAGNQEQHPPSSPSQNVPLSSSSILTNHLSPPLRTSDQERQPPPLLSQNISSKLTNFPSTPLRTGDREQHPPPSPSQNVPFNSSSNGYNSNFQQSKVLSTPSYHIEPNEFLRRWTAEGSIILV